MHFALNFLAKVTISKNPAFLPFALFHSSRFKINLAEGELMHQRNQRNLRVIQSMLFQFEK